LTLGIVSPSVSRSFRAGRSGEAFAHEFSKGQLPARECFAPTLRGEATEYNSAMSLRAGQRAPDFRVVSAEGTPVSLSDYRGRWTVLVFLRWLG
jgi:hypothetical protein